VKKLKLALLIPLLISSNAFAATCQNSMAANAAGCEIDTSNTDYILTGDIAPASGVDGIEFVSGSDANTVSQTGNITTTGTGASGVSLFFSDANTINLNGNITTTGAGALGVFLVESHANTLNLTGDIATVGEQAFGVYLGSSDDNIVNLTGDITATGDNTAGVYVDGSDASIINLTGDITTTGDTADAIRLSNSDNAIINLSGKLSATGPNSYAVLGDPPDTVSPSSMTLNLLAGSQVIGRIDLGGTGDNDTANVYASGVSSSLTFENAENINLFGLGAVIGDTVVTVDATGESTREAALSQFTSSVHNLISQRMTYTTPLKLVQVAALSLSPGMYFEERKPIVWSQFFGGNFDRDAEGSSLGYDISHAGLNFGYEWDVNYTRVGLMGGISRASTETQTASFQTDTDSYYVGAYGHFKLGMLNLTTSLLGGYSDSDNARVVVNNLNGLETARSDVDSTFISPSITLAAAFKTADRVELRPSVSVNYSMAWMDDYQEIGATGSNLSVDDRTVEVLTARAQLAAALQLNDATEFEFRAGVSTRNGNSDDVDASIVGNSFSYSNAGAENVTGRFAGVNLRIAAQNNLNLVVDMEFGGNNKENYVNGQIGLDYVF